MRRDDLGGQSSNDYFFPALGSPSQTLQAKGRRLKIQKVSRTPMMPMAGRRGQARPLAADISSHPAPTNATGGPRRGCPPIESLGDCSIDFQSDSPSEAPAVRKRTANVRLAEPRKTIPERAKAPFADLGLARMAWNSLVERVRAAHGAKEFRKFRFRDVTIVSADIDGAGAVHLTLRSPAPEKAEAGFAEHETTISQALRGFYGRTVKLRVIGNEPASAPPDQPSKSKRNWRKRTQGG